MLGLRLVRSIPELAGEGEQGNGQEVVTNGQE
jgi:hypothetical protein